MLFCPFSMTTLLQSCGCATMFIWAKERRFTKAISTEFNLSLKIEALNLLYLVNGLFIGSLPRHSCWASQRDSCAV
jgi:hypothetical protein